MLACDSTLTQVSVCLDSSESSTDSEPKTKQTKLAGFALHCFSYSTWEGIQMYLDDLFVRDEYRSEFILL